MPLRFIQVFVSEDGGPDLETLLEGHEVLGTWHDTRGAGRLVSSLLVAAEAAEEIMDRLEQAYSGHEGFRVILFPVEAVLPRPKEVEDPEANGEEQSESSNDGGGRISREELYHDITETLGVTRVYIPMVVLSSIVAAVGLARDDVAVVIGAMVIAPLLGPNVAMSLAVTLGDLKLLRRALLTNIIGVSVALVIALLMGVVFSIDPTVPAIESRTHLRIGDSRAGPGSRFGGYLRIYSRYVRNGDRRDGRRRADASACNARHAGRWRRIPTGTGGVFAPCRERRLCQSGRRRDIPGPGSPTPHLVGREASQDGDTYCDRRLVRPVVRVERDRVLHAGLRNRPGNGTRIKIDRSLTNRHPSGCRRFALKSSKRLD